jgi:hypothetical protein
MNRILTASVVFFGAMVGACSDSTQSSTGTTGVGGATAGSTSSSSGAGGGSLCADRAGGALVTVANPDGTRDGPDQIVLWIEDSSFIDEAIEHLENHTWRLGAFEEVIAEADCDALHPWHVDPVRVAWADVATEECDATVTYVTQNLEAWVARPHPNWCPWSGKITAVDDRR